MNNLQILETISKTGACTVKTIAKNAKFDADCAALYRIADKCWEMVEAGVLIAFDTRCAFNGGLFFDVMKG